MSSTLCITIDLRLMGMPPLRLVSALTSTRRALIARTTFQEPQIAINIASRHWHIAGRSPRRGASRGRGWRWIRVADCSLRSRGGWLCKATRGVLVSTTPICLWPRRSRNVEWSPAMHYPSGILRGPCVGISITHRGRRKMLRVFVEASSCR